MKRTSTDSSYTMPIKGFNLLQERTFPVLKWREGLQQQWHI